MPTRDFDAARAERLRLRDPIRFQLGGHTFTCLPVIPVGAGLDLVDAPEVADHRAGAAKALVAFIDNTLIDDDRPRLHAVLRDRSNPIGAADLLEVVSWLAEEYAARPTSPPADSSGGRDSTGAPSSSDADEKELAISPI